MSMFIFSAENIPYIPAIVKTELSMATRAGTKILVAEGSKVQSIISEFISVDMISGCVRVPDAMQQCDSAIVLWDVRESSTGRVIDALSDMHKQVRIYDMILNKWS